nr:MAG TPA: hypothetical protein [Caudoviricetes sp.]
MEQDKILTHVYVVKVESKQQDKDNSNDVCDIHLGVLRIFANKEDAMAYMREYYDKCQLTSKSIEIFENGNGYFSVKVRTWSDNISGSVCVSGEKLENRICETKVSCYATEITTSFDKEKISVDDDYYDEFFG